MLLVSSVFSAAISERRAMDESSAWSTPGRRRR